MYRMQLLPWVRLTRGQVPQASASVRFCACGQSAGPVHDRRFSLRRANCHHLSGSISGLAVLWGFWSAVEAHTLLPNLYQTCSCLSFNDFSTGCLAGPHTGPHTGNTPSYPSWPASPPQRHVTCTEFSKRRCLIRI